MTPDEMEKKKVGLIEFAESLETGKDVPAAACAMLSATMYGCTKVPVRYKD